jgi:hypothetical protein
MPKKKSPNSVRIRKRTVSVAKVFLATAKEFLAVQTTDMRHE